MKHKSESSYCSNPYAIQAMKNILIIYERHANLKYKYGNRQFWCRGYYVDTAGKNAKAISEYIKHQLDEDKIQDQITMKEFVDPFKGSK